MLFAPLILTCLAAFHTELLWPVQLYRSGWEGKQPAWNQQVLDEDFFLLFLLHVIPDAGSWTKHYQTPRLASVCSVIELTNLTPVPTASHWG